MKLNPFKRPAPDKLASDLPGPQALTADMLSDLLVVEQTAYSHPWTQTNFTDAMTSGYHIPVWLHDGQILAYLVAMRGADEVHLLNFTVAPAYQARGLGRMMMQHLVAWSRSQGVHAIWLEVRLSNERAIHIYKACGFTQDGIRSAYYPAHNGVREDAVIMSLNW